MPKTAPAKEKNKGLDQFLNELVRRFEDLRFFAPSIALTRDVIERLHCLTDNKYRVDQSDEKVLKAQQKILAEQFYFYLANISKKTRALSGESIPLKEVIDFNFDKAIGLSYEQEDRNILDKFTAEFISWLKDQGGEVETGWGIIKLTSEDRIKFTRFSKENDDNENLLEDSKRSRHPFRSKRNLPT